MTSSKKSGSDKAETSTDKPRTPSRPTSSKTYNEAAAYHALKWLNRGHDETQIREALQKEYPKADYAATLAKVMEHLQNVGAADPVTINGWCFEAARDLYQQMVEIGDYANALRAIKEIHRLANGGR